MQIYMYVCRYVPSFPTNVFRLICIAIDLLLSWLVELPRFSVDLRRTAST